MVSRGVKQPTRLLPCILCPGMDKVYSATTTEMSLIFILQEKLMVHLLQKYIYTVLIEKFTQTLLCEKYTSSAAMHLYYIK